MRNKALFFLRKQYKKTIYLLTCIVHTRKNNAYNMLINIPCILVLKAKEEVLDMASMFMLYYKRGRFIYIQGVHCEML